MPTCLYLKILEERQAMHKTFEIPLDIPDVTIEKVETNRHGDFVITVKSTIEGTYCHRCGKKITKVYGDDREITFRHLSILGRKTFIRLRPVRYQCLSCNGSPTTTQQLSWYNPRSSYTKPYEEHLLLGIVNSTIQDVSIKEDIGYEAIMGILDRHIQVKVDWDTFSRLDVIGIDEISLKKGHRDFVTIITGRLDNKTVILGVLSDRKKTTVKLFLSDMPRKLRKTIQAVCSDMYDGFIHAAKEIFGKQVKIVIDRFHVAKLYRKGLDTLRKQELRRLKQELSEEEYTQLQGAMWALRKKEDKRTDEEKDVLARLFIYAPQLKVADELCNTLTRIFEKDITKRRAKFALKNWMHGVKDSALHCFDTFLKTLEKWMDEIANYFLDRQTSGFVEGFNNKIKVIKRRCYGILNVKHLFQRIHLDLSGYALFAQKIR
jgi:transposase